MFVIAVYQKFPYAAWSDISFVSFSNITLELSNEKQKTVRLYPPLNFAPRATGQSQNKQVNSGFFKRRMMNGRMGSAAGLSLRMASRITGRNEALVPETISPERLAQIMIKLFGR